MSRIANLVSICALLVWALFSTGMVCAAEESVQITIEGLTNTEQSNVAAALVLPPGLVTEGKVDTQWLERFQKQIPVKVSKAMEPFGYYKPEVSVNLDRAEKEIYRLHVIVKKGEPVRLTKVSVKAEGPGAGEKSFVEMVSRFPLRKGDILRQDVYERAKDGLKNKLVDLGYLDADFSTHTIEVSLASLESEIALVIQTGHQYHFGEAYFSGSMTYPETFLRRYLQFKPGEVFSYDKIARTQTSFVNADRFRQVVVTPRKEEAEDYRVPVEINLSPSPPKRFKIGAGFGTDTGPRGTILYRDVNVKHWGHSFTTEMTLSTTLQALAAGYVIPDRRDANSLTSLKMALKHEDTKSYTTDSYIAEAERARTFSGGRIGSFFVQLQKENSEAAGERTNSFVLVPGFRFSGRYYDKPIRPSKGYNFQTELRGTHKAFGSDTGFVQLLANGEMRVPLTNRFSFLTRMKMATTWQEEPLTNLPIPFRFFAGGDNSVRGYTYQSLGPKDENGVIGGKHLLVGNFELERAIGSNWGVAVFYDAGNAFNDVANIRPAQSVGLGCRYYTPVGPLKLDLARQVGVQDPGYRLHLSIGLEL